MTKRLVPALAVTYFIAMALAVTYPGYVPFNRIHPFVLGMPFALFWQLLWIVGAVLVLAAVFLWESRGGAQERSRRTAAREDGPPATGGGA